LLNEDLVNSHDNKRGLGSLTDLPDELDALDYDVSRGISNNLIPRFEYIFFIAKRYNIQWESYKDLFYRELMDDILILETQNTVNHAIGDLSTDFSPASL
jgi:hypothetical protein